MKRLVLIALAVSLVGGVGITCACKAGIVTPPYVGLAKVWSVAVCKVDGPFSGDPLEVSPLQVLTADHVTDVQASLIADPFLMQEGETLYLFYEVLNDDTNQGDLAVSVSTDGEHWTYQGVVLDEDFHLSYPQVFRHQGNIFMIPESCAAGSVRLYRATNFPTEWQFERTLIEKPLVDPTIFQHGDHWWLFASPADDWDDLHLYLSESLDSANWREHPQSPIVEGSKRFARQGGRIIQEDGRIFRIAQDHKLHYGHQVWSMEIDKLTPLEYSETLTSRLPILTADGKGWNEIGMHHLDMLALPNGKRIMSVDGLEQRLVVGPVSLSF